MLPGPQAGTFSWTRPSSPHCCSASRAGGSSGRSSCLSVATPPEATAGRGPWLCPFRECLSEPLSTLHSSLSVIFLEKTSMLPLKLLMPGGRLPPQAVSCSAFRVQRAASLLRCQSACLLGCSSNPIVTRVSEKRKKTSMRCVPLSPSTPAFTPSGLHCPALQLHQMLPALVGAPADRGCSPRGCSCLLRGFTVGCSAAAPLLF